KSVEEGGPRFHAANSGNGRQRSRPIPIKRIFRERDLATAKERMPAVAKKQKKRKGMSFEDRPILEPNAGAVDVGARQMYVAVPPERDPNPVRVFDTFTEDLEKLATWLEQCGVTTVAMESTGVYWIP